MTAVEPPHHPGLRERKKQRTRETIARVALELFAEHGFHETTIRQIADAAEVSPRTVSAYFPVKEELAFADDAADFDSLEAQLTDRHPGETVADALRRWICDHFLSDPSQLERNRCRRELVESEPALRRYERGRLAQVERIIAAAVAVDLELAPDDLLPRMVGAATIAAFDALGQDAKDHSGDTAESLSLLDDALAFVGGGVEALAARRGVGR